MLTTFTLTRFKSYEKAELPLGALTVLIGANAAGKSNVIEALRLLSWLAQGQKLGSIKYAVNSADKVVRGRVEDLCRADASAFALGCSINEGEWPHLSIGIGLRAGELHVIEERISSTVAGVNPLYELVQPSSGASTDAVVAYNNFARGGKKPHITVSDQMAVFTQLDSPASFQPNHDRAQEEIPKAVRHYQRLLAGVLFLDPVPARMRDYSFASEKQLQGDGANLSSVLYDLWGREEQVDERHAANRADILSFIRSLPEQDIDRLSFLTAPRGEVMVQLVETFGGVPKACDAPLLSDGTLRVLAIAAAMLSAQEGSLVVIEEIDNGVHPSRAHHLLERLKAIAERRQLKVLLSTHNPALLDALPADALKDVVFCYRDPEHGDSRLAQLGKVPDIPELLVKGSLGHLLTTGAIDRFVKHHPGPAARKAKAKEWLASLRSGGAREVADE